MFHSYTTLASPGDGHHSPLERVIGVLHRDFVSGGSSLRQLETWRACVQLEAFLSKNLGNTFAEVGRMCRDREGTFSAFACACLAQFLHTPFKEAWPWTPILRRSLAISWET